MTTINEFSAEADPIDDDGPSDISDRLIHPRLEEQLQFLGLDAETPPTSDHLWRALLAKLSQTYNTEFEDAAQGPSARRLVATAPELIFSLSAEDGRITSLNPAFEALTGYPRAAWLGQSLTPLMHPADLERTFAHLQEALQGRTPPVFEARLRTRSGAVCPTEIAVSPLRQGSRVVGIRGTARDLIRIPRRSHSADHDAAILQDIRGEIVRALDRPAGGSHEPLQELGHRLADLIHLSIHRSQLEKQPIDLRQTLSEIAARYESLAIEHRTHAVDPQVLLGNRDRLVRLLTALIERILQWVEQPAIHLYAESRLIRPGLCEVLFSVTARGEESATHDLEPTLPRESATTGALNQRLIEAMGGEIKSASYTEEEWRCLFTLRMPGQDQPLEPKAEPPPPEQPRTALRILAADENSVHRKILNLMLTRLGHRTEEVEDGLDVLDQLARQSYDLVMLSEDLPEFSALDTFQAIHSRFPTAQRPALILIASASSPEDDLVQRVDGVLYKPIQLQELEACLATATDRQMTESGSGTPHGANTDSVVRLEPLEQLHALRADMVTQLVGNFLTNAAEQVGAILQASAEENFGALRDVAHSLKGSSATLGAVGLADVCRTLENHGNNREPVPADHLEKLTSVFDQVRKIFENQLETWARAEA